MRPFLPLLVGLAGWFLVAVLVLSTLFSSPPARPMGPAWMNGPGEVLVVQPAR